MQKYKSSLKFIIIVIISGFLGGSASRLLSHMDTLTLGKTMSNFLITYSPHLLTVSVLALLGFAILFYQKAKQLYAKSDRDDDQAFDTIDHNLNVAMMLCSLVFVAAFLFFGIFTAGISQINSGDGAALLSSMVTTLVFAGGTFGSLYLQTRAIQITKLLYPNKKGNLLDSKFNKDWLDSCDEAEQYIIFRSAYAAYQVIQKCILFFWIITVFGALLFGTGILPIIVVTALWGVLIMSYTISCRKLEKKRLR